LIIGIPLGFPVAKGGAGAKQGFFKQNTPGTNVDRADRADNGL